MMNPHIVADDEESKAALSEYMNLPDFSSLATAHANHPKKTRPPLLRISPLPGGYIQRAVEIPRETVGLVIGNGGKTIQDMCTQCSAKIQFRVNKTAEREGRPGLLEIHGNADKVDHGMQLVWDLLQLIGKEYNEVPMKK
jgi:hypothetical protein